MESDLRPTHAASATQRSVRNGTGDDSAAGGEGVAAVAHGRCSHACVWLGDLCVVRDGVWELLPTDRRHAGSGARRSLRCLAIALWLPCVALDTLCDAQTLAWRRTVSSPFCRGCRRMRSHCRSAGCAGPTSALISCACVHSPSRWLGW